MSTASIDKVLDLIELVLIESKFYTIFSVLFGIGFSILMTRAEAKGLVFRRFFLRRAFFLYLIGLAHAVFFWHNDILQYYALCGVLLLPFVRATNRTIVAAASVALVMPTVIALWGAIPRGTFSGPRQFLFQQFGFTSEARVAIWSGGSLGDIILLNVSFCFAQFDYVMTSGMIFKIYGCFLLGLYIGRNEVHRNLLRFAPKLKRLAVLGVTIGIPLNVVYARNVRVRVAAAGARVHRRGPPAERGLRVSVGLAVEWSARQGSWADVCSGGPDGPHQLHRTERDLMVIFRGVGLGLGGTIGPALYLPLGVAIYLVQLAASRAWLRRFHYGPLEWLWRMLTYGSGIPLRKRAVVD